MIGVFDSGHGGLTILDALHRRMPQHDFLYFGDHGNAPYGDKSGPEIVALTKAAVDWLFRQGCPAVILGCNTATAVAARTLQQDWLNIAWPGRKLLGIIAPTVEAVTQTPWCVQEPMFPQRYNTDTVALFATSVTVNSGVYETEISKRCPRVRLISQACPGLVPLIESGDPEAELPALVGEYVQILLARLDKAPEWAILGCTHYPLIEPIFRELLPRETRLMSQPMVVANALEDYLFRHGELGIGAAGGIVRYVTTGNVAEVERTARMMTGRAISFSSVTVDSTD